MKLPALPTDCPQESLFSINQLSICQHQILEKLGNRVFNFYENRVLLTHVCESGLLHKAPCLFAIFTSN